MRFHPFARTRQQSRRRASSRGKALPLALLALAALTLLGRSMPRSPAALAEGATVTQFVSGDIVITISRLSSLPWAPNLIFHGDAIQVEATTASEPLPPGAPLPLQLTGLALEYREPLPTSIQDERLLGPFYSATGNEWSRIPCPASGCIADREKNSIVLDVARVGYYALAAPEVGRIEIAPAQVSLLRGQKQQFSAAVFDAAGNEVPSAPVAWWADPRAGSIDTAGLFVASGAPGEYPAAVKASLGETSAAADVRIEWWRLFLPLLHNRWSLVPVPNDLYYSLQWNLRQVGLPQAWAFSTGQGAPIIAVLDTGADLAHPDLAANLLPGYDFVNGDGEPQDDNGHGSHVTGIIGAVGNNGQGVCGLLWQAQIMPLKILDENGSGYVWDAALALKWAVESGARVINMSFGTTEGSQLLEEAIKGALYDDSGARRNTIIVAAAGNVGSANIGPGATVYPAAYPGVLAVGATDSQNRLASFSNQASFLDLVAPGVQILSTLPQGRYSTYSGTSMASPHVTGAAALIWAAHPELTADQVVALLLQGAIDLGEPGWDPAFGHGLVNVTSSLWLASQGAGSLASQGLPSGPTQVSGPPKGAASAAHRPGVVLLKVQEGAPPAVQRALAAFGSAGKLEPAGIPGWYVARVPPGREQEAVERLRGQPGVQHGELDYLIFAM